MSPVNSGVALSGFKRTKGVLSEPAGTMRVRRATFVTLGLMSALTTVWAAGATTFILMRDDLATRLITRQVENQYAYEERITALRTHVDRLASRAVIDQDTVEARVADLMSRQSQLESRSAMVAMLAQNAGMAAADAAQAGSTAVRKAPAGVVPPLLTAQPPVPAAALGFAAPAKPTPLVETAPLRGAPLRSGENAPDRETREVRERISSIGKALDSIEAANTATVMSIESRSRQQVARLRNLLADVGISPDKMAAAEPPAKDAGKAAAQAVGGPLVPITDPNAVQFDAALKRAQSMLGAANRLKKTVRTLPVRQPIPNSIADMTSNYGPRSDPFTRGFAMHTGIDFRAETGTPVRATAAGKVITSDYTGGYGNMVEIDHGNGLTTRYAHLSELLVEEGQMIEAGKIVGKVGSTGRSTGPHLHYETRVSGDPTDPSRFIRTGQKYRDLL